MKIPLVSFDRRFLILFFLFVFLSLGILQKWTKKHFYDVTGDEPHYLVVASGIVDFHTFEQSKPYAKEFSEKNIFKPGLAPAGAIPVPGNTHAHAGPHGLYNGHNIGLPLLVSIPFFIGGVEGTKVFLVALNSGLVLFAWLFARQLSEDSAFRFWAVSATCLVTSFLTAASQVYPDMLAGVLSLGGLYWIFILKRDASISKGIFFSVLIALLPWLQIKLMAPAVVMGGGAFLRMAWNKKYNRAALMLLPMAASWGALVYYNFYAFGRISGPYLADALVFNITSLMVSIGLLLDQNQGFLFYSPIFWVGLFSLDQLFKYDRFAAVLWVVVFLLLLIPNGLHPNWYGGGSFSGRFSWSAAVVFVVPTLFGLNSLYMKSKKIFWGSVFAGLSLQLAFYLFARAGVVNLYNSLQGTELRAYSKFYAPLERWLPALYDSNWAFTHLPNYVFFVFLSLAILSNFNGIAGRLTMSRWRIPAYGCIVAAICLAGFWGHKDSELLQFRVPQLPSQTGVVDAQARIGRPGIDPSGFLTFGPYVALRRGEYEVKLKYSSSAPDSQKVGLLQIGPAMQKDVTVMDLNGTDGADKDLTVRFSLENWFARPVEFRTFWNGSYPVSIEGVTLRYL